MDSTRQGEVRFSHDLAAGIEDPAVLDVHNDVDFAGGRSETDEPKPNHLWDRLPNSFRRATALGLTALAAAAGGYFIRGGSSETDSKLHNLAGEVAAYNGVKPATVLGEGLRPISALPGYHMEVSAARQQELADSLLLLVKRPKGTSEPWQPDCSANKVEITANNALTSGDLTSAHCLAPPTEPAKASNAVVINEVKLDTNEYALALPLTKDNIDKPIKPIAKVTAISTVVHGTQPGDQEPDIALLKVGPMVPYGDMSDYNQRKALQVPGSQQAVPGEEVAMHSAITFGLNGAPNAPGVAERGRFVGQLMSFYNGEPGGQIQRRDDYVVADVKGKQATTMARGVSGSVALGANGAQFGTSSFLFINPHQLPNPNTGSQLSDAYRFDLGQQQIFRVKYGPNTSVNVYTALTPYLLSGLVAGLENAK